jgi:hypothetical protein
MEEMTRNKGLKNKNENSQINEREKNGRGKKQSPFQRRKSFASRKNNNIKSCCNNSVIDPPQITNRKWSLPSK